VPRIAHHLGQHEQTVRAWIKAFLAGGFDALPNLPRGGGHSAFTPALIAATHAMILRAYPNNPAARKAMRAHAKCRKPR
jgi:hypothetical protein